MKGLIIPVSNSRNIKTQILCLPSAVVWESQAEWFSKGYQWTIGNLFFLTILLNTQNGHCLYLYFWCVQSLKFVAVRSRTTCSGLFVRHVWSWLNSSVPQLLSGSRFVFEVGKWVYSIWTVASLAPWLCWDLSVTKQRAVVLAFGPGECSLVIAQFSVTVWCTESVPENNLFISGVHQNFLLTGNFQ